MTNAQNQPENRNVEYNTREGDLEERIKLQRGVHDVLQESTSFKLKVQKSANILLSALITLVVFTDINILKNYYPSINEPKILIFTGLLALAIFLINALFDSFFVESNNSLHIRAIQQYTDLSFDLKTAKIKSEDESLSEDELNHFYRRYLQISQNSHTTTGKAFDSAQKQYLQRKALRKAREENPFYTKKQAKRRAVEISKKPPAGG
tara:strand:+ start:477 stop:1100 length:624 start_codon:yes stop_codon:yes gene_type:complete